MARGALMWYGRIEDSPIYSADLAPVPDSRRTWTTWNLAAVWVGMAACIPTYILASYMIRSGLGWIEALAVILLANVIVTMPMVLNGHAGAKYGVPFAVLGRASFGVAGIHVPALVRALVACGWFGVQAWIGGLAIYAIACTLVDAPIATGLTVGKFTAFGLSWAITMFFVWRGTESIRLLESWAAPVLIGIGLLLLVWGANQGGGLSDVLDQSAQLERPTAKYKRDGGIALSPLRTLDGEWKADKYRISVGSAVERADWRPVTAKSLEISPNDVAAFRKRIDDAGGEEELLVQFRRGQSMSTPAPVSVEAVRQSSLATWMFWLTAMVGFWATMSISIADITRFARSQRAQVVGQFIGLPSTMLLYSFVSVFVTCAALIGFDEILIAEDAPWDPVALVGRFDEPIVVVAMQLVLFIATLTTNIAANVIAPANAFANLCPRAISFRSGGLIAGLLAVAVSPWVLFDRISELLVFVSGLLGPVLGVMLADYYWVRRTRLSIADLFNPAGPYRYRRGVNPNAMASLALGVATALVGYFVPMLHWLYNASWFSGFLVSFLVYGALAHRNPLQKESDIHVSSHT